MKLTTKGSYGLRAMVDIAINSRGTHVTLSSVAIRQDLSVQYLEQLFSTLKKAGYLESIKGSSGGYSLATNPENITAAMILKALEGDISIVGNNKAKVDEENYIEKSITINLWDKIDESMFAILNNVTLKDLVDEALKFEGSNLGMFYI